VVAPLFDDRNRTAGTGAGDEPVPPMLYHHARPPLARIMTIDRALRARAWPNTRTLADEIRVDRRTIRRDIDYMRDQLNAPIEFDCVRNGYYYTEPTFCLPFPQLTQGEMLSLYLSERMMRQFRGTPFERDLRQAIKKLSELLPDRVSVRLDMIADFLSVLPAVQADYDPDLFCTVMRAASGRRRLKMVYWTASRNETTSRIFDPYELSLIDDGWYAFGYCHRSDEVRMFAVQRVRSVEETGESFDRPADFRVADFMRGSFRAMRGEGAYDVVLRFGSQAAGWIREKQWHPSQVHEDRPDGSLVVRFHLNDLRDIKRWAMFWGTDCEILAPPELRELIACDLREMRRREEASGTKEPLIEVRSKIDRTKGKSVSA
jgi:predicted DNA-binding transcriptional regulator YafY